MADERFAHLIAFLEQKLEEARDQETLPYEELREDVRTKVERIAARVDGVARRLSEAEHRRAGGSSWWGARMPKA